MKENRIFESAVTTACKFKEKGYAYPLGLEVKITVNSMTIMLTDGKRCCSFKIDDPGSIKWEKFGAGIVNVIQEQIENLNASYKEDEKETEKA